MTRPIIDQIALRSWQDTDFDSAVTLNREAEEHIGIGSETGDWARDMEGIAETFIGSGGEFLVGHIDEELVVMGGYKCLSTGGAEVKRMRVTPSLQGWGVGPWLLGQLEERMMQAGIGNVVVSTLSVQSAALKLYARAGYEETGREMLTEGVEAGFTVVSFAKSLGS